MTNGPLIVLADDITGAAEIAAIAHQFGLRAAVHLSLSAGKLEGDVVVINTETRLLSPARAATQVARIAQALNQRPHSGWFKKTDSVLRGPVLAELRACLPVLGYQRALLVPCNPSLGRVIRDGKYYVGGAPLHRTAFAHDPHHPRFSADVRHLLEFGSSAAQPTVRARKLPPSTIVCCAPSMRTPPAGIVVGEADTPADVFFWSGQVDAETLPAGGADFFRAWLHSRLKPQPIATIADVTSRKTLLLSGTSTPPTPVSPLPGHLIELNPSRIARVADLTSSLRQHLVDDGFAAIAIRGSPAANPRIPVALTRRLRDVAIALHRTRSFQHLILAGGATASSVLSRLGWTKLAVAHVWGPGVVTLRPVRASRYAVTVKPGSYAWPASLARHFEESNVRTENAAR